MKKTSLLTVVALCAFTVLVGLNKARSQNSQESFNVFIYAVTGPVKTSANYQSWANSEVQKLYSVGNLDADDIGHQLLTTNVTQPADDSNQDSLWFAVKITTTNTTPTLALNMLRFAEKSSDQYDAFADSYDLTTVSGLVYSPRALGVIWNASGPRVSDTLINDALTSGTNLVNEIDFIGMQSSYIQCGPSYTYAQADGYIHGVTTNLLLTDGCSIVNSNGVAVALGQKTLQTTGGPDLPILTIGADTANQRVWVGSDMDTNATIKLYHTYNLRTLKWDFLGTMNAGDLYWWPNTNSPPGFFRAILE